MSLIGHNRGPTMEGGASWRRYAWSRARADLLPRMPLEIVRLRVRRARDLGIDYTAYASIRAASGHDVVALLFSSNALRVGPAQVHLTGPRADKVAAIRQCGRMALIHAPLEPSDFLDANATFDAAGPAPLFTDTWPALREAIRSVTAGQGIPGDRVVLIGDTGFERSWTDAGKLAGYLSADRYFAD
jgi:hypothetical protein